jgi:hypothetical protein
MVEFSKIPRFLKCQPPASRSGQIVVAGVIAGILATLVQASLWLLFTDEFPGVLYRDARLTAALVMGGRVLPPPATFDAGVMAAATLIHFALSVLYAALLAPVASRLGSVAALPAGAAFGIALYIVNLYGFTELFPWFDQARGWIAVVAHVAFGAAAIFAFRILSVRNARSRPGGH